jgi:hypothetical protein
MGNDSQNKKRTAAERAASLRRRDSVPDTERKLSEARRLFSLRDFVACDALLLQVLETDPLNSQAKALNELTAIKLQKRKLYNKLVDPRSPGKSQPSSISRQIAEGPLADPNVSSQVHSPLTAAKAISQADEVLQSEADETSGMAVDDGPSMEASVSKTDTMRERTIAALVQLFKEKEKKLEEWRDPRFNATPPETLEAADSGDETSADLGDEDMASLAISWQSLEGSQEIRKQQNDSKVQPQMEQLDTPLPATKPQTQPAIPLPSLEIVEEIRQLKHEPVIQAETEPLRKSEERPLTPKIDKVQPLVERKGKGLESSSSSQTQLPHFPEDRDPEFRPTKVIRLPKVGPFEQITSPKRVDYKRLMERKLEERSEDLKNSELKTVTIAQIKKYLYKEEYELCARELENIQKRFPDNEEIQAFVENTSKRLSELQRLKGFEMLAKELMLSASFHYQQGKLPEALIATNEVLRVMPEHTQARQFAELVEKRLEKERKKALSVDKVRYCWACGVAVDSISHYCHHCGHRLS